GAARNADRPRPDVAADRAEWEERGGEPRARVARVDERRAGEEAAGHEPEVEPALVGLVVKRPGQVEEVDQRDAGEAGDRDRAGDAVGNGGGERGIGDGGAASGHEGLLVLRWLSKQGSARRLGAT